MSPVPDILHFALITSHLALNGTARTVTVEVARAHPRLSSRLTSSVDLCVFRVRAWTDETQ